MADCIIRDLIMYDTDPSDKKILSAYIHNLIDDKTNSVLLRRVIE